MKAADLLNEHGDALYAYARTRLKSIIWFGSCALAAGWLLLAGTAYENTLYLAATGKVDLGLSLFYRFRDSTIVTDGSWGGPGLKVFLALCALIGVRAAWALTIVSQAALLRDKSNAIQLTSLALLCAGVIWGEALLVWNLLFALLVTVWSRMTAARHALALSATLCAVAGLLCSIELAWILGNPMRSVTRQRVLGGKSFQDTLSPHLRSPGIELYETCVAALNPDDLRGVQSAELLSRASLGRFAQVVLVDLKVIQQNYRYLALKDEKGEFVFSHAARTFAEKEKAYADTVRVSLETASSLCLIAPFDRLPDQEAYPYSRAREILDVRKQAGLTTKVIQLANR
jgi:hypothetical protein